MKWLSLLISAICSQMVPLGYLLMFANVLGGFWGSANLSMVFFSLAVLMSGPFVMSLYFKSGWQGVLAGVFALVFGWLSVVITTLITHNPLVFSGAAASMIIITILVITQKVTSGADFIWMILGVGTGILLSVASAALLRKEGYDAYSYFFFQFLWVWLSAIFFPDLFQRRVGRNDVIAWVAMIAVFPFIIDSIYTVVFGKGR